MTPEELAAIRDWWLCSPEEFAARPRWPLRDARADIAALLGEVLRLRALVEAARESHQFTIEGTPAW